MAAHLIQGDLQIFHARFQLLAVVAQYFQKALQLHACVARAVVQLNDLFGFHQRQAQTFGAQRQAQTRAIACAVDAGAPSCALACGL
ncbi:hypothetical protein D3C72_2357260 [compost metagenome]